MSKQTKGDAAHDCPANPYDDSLNGIAAGAMVLTLDGALPVEFLSPGDRIITRNGMRVLRGVAVRVVRNARAIHIAPSTLGHGRPEEALTVAPGQGIVIRDWRAKALRGTRQATLPAARLVDGFFVRSIAVQELRVFSLTFDTDEVVYAGALELACPREAATV